MVAMVFDGARSRPPHDCGRFFRFSGDPDSRVAGRVFVLSEPGRAGPCGDRARFQRVRGLPANHDRPYAQ